MILLDTNLISEMMRASPEPRVRDWLNAQEASAIHVSAITLAEIAAGLEVLPEGRRRRDLLERFERMEALFSGRILSFGPGTARCFGALIARTRSTGHAVSLADGLIAATALEHGFSIATRDVSPFKAAGVSVVNPWEDGNG